MGGEKVNELTESAKLMVKNKQHTGFQMFKMAKALPTEWSETSSLS